MPTDGIGFSFQPGATDIGMGGGRRGGGGGPRGASPQEAVRILSLRVPERPSPTAIAPLPLLQSKGSAAAGAQGLDSLVAALMQGFRPPMQSNAPFLPNQTPTFGIPPQPDRPRQTPMPVPGTPSLPYPQPNDDVPVFTIPPQPDRPRPPVIPEPPQPPFQPRPREGPPSPKEAPHPTPGGPLPPPVITFPHPPAPTPSPIPEEPPQGPTAPIDVSPQPEPDQGPLFGSGELPWIPPYKRDLYDDYQSLF